MVTFWLGWVIIDGVTTVTGIRWARIALDLGLVHVQLHFVLSLPGVHITSFSSLPSHCFHPSCRRSLFVSVQLRQRQ